MGRQGGSVQRTARTDCGATPRFWISPAGTGGSKGGEMSYKIDEIEGIGQSFAANLAKAKIQTTDDLLKRCSTPQKHPPAK